MPHQCTNCGRTFDDGSKEMLSGCPDCDGSTFQFRPDGADLDDAPPEEPPEPPERPGGKVSRTVGKTAATVRDVVSSGSSTDAEPPSPDGPDRPGDDDIIVAEEDTAQASARTDVVRPDELPSDPPGDGEHNFEPIAATTEPEATTATSTTGESDTDAEAHSTAPDRSEESRPDLKELREELNDQFESIKVLSPGQYELNLMELYDREEYIIALEEDGRYSIQVPERFQQ